MLFEVKTARAEQEKNSCRAPKFYDCFVFSTFMFSRWNSSLLLFSLFGSRKKHKPSERKQQRRRRERRSEEEKLSRSVMKLRNDGNEARSTNKHGSFNKRWGRGGRTINYETSSGASGGLSGRELTKFAGISRFNGTRHLPERENHRQ